jgi:hypothetical protein
MVSFSTLPNTIAPSRPFPIGSAFSQIVPEGVLYHNFKPVLCEKPAVTMMEKINVSGFIMLTSIQNQN